VGMLHTFNHVLRPAFPDLRVELSLGIRRVSVTWRSSMKGSCFSSSEFLRCSSIALETLGLCESTAGRLRRRGFSPFGDREARHPLPAEVNSAAWMSRCELGSAVRSSDKEASWLF